VRFRRRLNRPERPGPNVWVSYTALVPNGAHQPDKACRVVEPYGFVLWSRLCFAAPAWPAEPDNSQAGLIGWMLLLFYASFGFR